MKKIVIGVISVLLIIFIIHFLKGCSSKNNSQKIYEYGTRFQQESTDKDKKIEELEKELENYQQQENYEEQEDIIQESKVDNEYLNVKFPYDGKYYKEAYNSVTFYSDSTCTEEIYDARFISAGIDEAQAKNGLIIYCLRLDSGEICYCTQRPYLITEEKYNEMN